MNILITSAGRRVSLVRAFQKELKALFPEGLVMTTDFKPHLSAACHVSDKSFDLPLVDDINYISLLKDICLKNNIKLIIPTIDTELKVLAKHSKNLIKNGSIPIISTEKFIDICRDKRQMNAFFLNHNIQVAKEYSKFDYKLPLFIKPLNGSRSADTFIITKHEDLTEYHFKNQDLMFLEYLDHNDFEEFTCDLYYDKHHQLKCVVPRKRLEVRDGEVNKGLIDKNELVDYIKTHLNYIEGAVGCLTSQFFKHKETDVIYGIEINARFGGGFPLTYFSGANYVKWLIEEYLFDKSIPFYNDWEDRLLMLRYDDEIFINDYE